MKQLHEITDAFKMTKVRVPMEGKLSEDFQKAMFTMGFRWKDTLPGTPREVRLTHGRGGSVYHGLYVDQDCRISGSVIPTTFNGAHVTSLGYREVTPLELFYAAREYKALDKAIRKAKKAEKKLINEGWIIRDGSDGVCPVAAGTKMNVMFSGKEFDTDRPELLDWRWTAGGDGGDIAAYRLSEPDGWIPYTSTATSVCPVDGSVLLDVKMNTGRLDLNTPAHQWRWETYGTDSTDIVAYRLAKQEPAKQEPVKQETISLQDMITNIVADAGGKEVDADGFIVHNPDTCTLPDFEAPDGLKAGEYEVKLRNGAVVDGVRTFGNDCDSPYQVVAYRRKPGTLKSSVDIPEKAEWELVPKQEDTFIEVPEVEPDTNPKKQYGLASIPLNLWSPLASAYGALGLYNGSLKYGTANFANTKVEASIYIAAAMRHLSAFAAGEEFDPADGVPNLGGVLANVAIILEARAAGTLIDDRAAMSGYLKERDALKAIVSQLQVVHAGKTPKHYTLGA